MTTPVDQIVRQRIVTALTSAANNPSSTVGQRDVYPVTEAIAAQVAPLVAHAANQEPWYQSRVTWGAIISITAPLLSLVGVRADLLTPDLAVSISTAAVTVVGGLLTLYGRWKAKAPLGS